MCALLKKSLLCYRKKRGAVENESSNNPIMATWCLLVLRRKGASESSSGASKFSERDQFPSLDIKDVHNIRRKESMGKP